ncbi:MAG: DNA/RNA nuclease SfsA [Bacteriovoracaceae bacterium]|nr:DNA/RNA nuclease SfsA [Bacteriovoracaceae bacterium]
MDLGTLFSGKIINRYKRFFADIELPDGKIITAHTPNTGSMKTCWQPGWQALLSHSDNPKRKLAYTLEFLSNNETWIGVNTSRTNHIVEHFLQTKQIPELKKYSEIKREVKFGASRIDFCLSNGAEELCYIEVKNVTLKSAENMAAFPDAVSTRAQKHLGELIKLKKQGHRAIIFFLVQREDVKAFTPALEIDPNYATWLKLAEQAGVEILIYQTALKGNNISLKGKLPLKWPNV